MILIAIDHAHGAPRRGAFELVSAARGLGSDVAAVVLGGPEAAPVAAALAAFVPSVVHVDDAALDHPSHERRTTALASVAGELGAEVVLLAAGRGGQAVAPRLALRLGGTLLEDVAAVRRDGTAVVAERLAYLSRASLTVRATAAPVVVSVKPGAYPAAAPADAPGSVASRSVAFTAADDAARPGERRSVARGRVALEEADVVVCGGRGLGDAASFERLVVGLADELGAGVASTRAVVDAGWRPYDEQVGQTGKSVAPKLYFALGVSGAVQHLSGMNRSGTVVAVNKDGDAPIFKASDYGIVGDVREVLPALRAALAGLD
ncbi:MAG: electron transfer flavoprotein subunit alpha/FixB family protein [Trueperaceae bacterium]